MPIEVQWLNKDKQFLLLNFVGEGIEDWDEYDLAVTRAWSLATTVEHSVIVIFAAYDATMPTGSPIPHLKQAITSLPDNVQLAISIVERNFEKMMVDMIAELKLDKSIQTVSSWDAANRLLKAQNMPTVALKDVPRRR